MNERPNALVGAAIKRREDDRLLRGEGGYIDDIEPTGTCHVAFVRSPQASARIKRVETTAAKAVEGVMHVLCADDFGEVLAKRMPQTLPMPLITAEISTPYPLARDEVCYVGEPIAVVVARTRQIAETAAQLVDVVLDSRPAVVTASDAARGETLVRSDVATNHAGTLAASYGDVDHAFAQADHRLSCELTTHRGGGHSMETRGVIAATDTFGDGVTMWTATQLPHAVRRHAASYLNLDEHNLRVVAPDVGGGFGPKGIFYPEEIILPALAMKLGVPVKWIEDRREHFLTAVQQRDQSWACEVAASDDGRVLGVRLKGLNDCGAYLAYGLLLPLNTMLQFPGPYTWPALDLKLDCYFTNLTPTSPVRGAGRPYANFVMERIMDLVAEATGIDRAEIRRRNLAKSEEYPRKTGMVTPAGAPVIHDSASNHDCLETALELADWDGFGARQAAAKADGRYLGLGLASYCEDGGIPPFEGCTVRVLPSGQVVVQSGAACQGQGHATILSQVVAETLGIDMERIDLKLADTAVMPRGIGTLGSRIAVAAGSSALSASQALLDKARQAAGILLSSDVSDLRHIGDGFADATGQSVSLAEIARLLNGSSGIPLPAGLTAGLEATSYHALPAPTYSNGTCIMEVELFPETGAVDLRKCIFVHDCGRAINPMIVDGQVLGGAVHGIGTALFEKMVFDAKGQPQSMNYGEYLLPTATEMPEFVIRHLETPTDRNPLGAKGVGESGAIPVAAATVSAIQNAMPTPRTIGFHPLSPEDIARFCGTLD